MKLAPIILFTYNRPEKTEKVIKALQKNELAKESKLYIFQDLGKGKEWEETKRINLEVKGFKEIHYKIQTQHKGLAESIIDGVTEIINEHGTAIILEDDIKVTNDFLKYMNIKLNDYKDNNEIGSITGYLYENDLIGKEFKKKRFCSWGWATWKNRWKYFNPNGTELYQRIKNTDWEKGRKQMLRDQIKGRNDSWAVRWAATLYLANKTTIYPSSPKVENIGMDGTGVHCNKMNTIDKIANLMRNKIENIQDGIQ